MILSYRFPSFSAQLSFPDGLAGYSEEWVSRALLPKLQSWRADARGLKVVVTQRGHLLVLNLEMEGPHLLKVDLVDLIDLTPLDLSTDPRVCPARLQGWLFSSRRNIKWHTVVLLCAFDAVLRSKKIHTGEYEIWPGLTCLVKVNRKTKKIVLEDLKGLPVYAEEGLV